MQKTILLLALFFYFPLSAQEGLAYSRLVDPATQTVIHTLEIDPNLYEIKAQKATESGLGRASLESIARLQNATAAINGGFFKAGNLLDGKPAGALKIHKWISLPSKARGCVGWSSSCDLIWDRLLISLKLQSPLGEFTINRFNDLSSPEELSLLSTDFYKALTPKTTGEEILFQEGRILTVQSSLKDSILPSDAWVLCIPENHPLQNSFRAEDSIDITARAHPQLNPSLFEKWSSCDYIVGGTPLLIYEGRLLVDEFYKEGTLLSFLTNRHARTAIGTLENGHLVFVVAEKRGLFDGFTMEELAYFMHFLGCLYALNLDGGGSSAFFYEDSIKTISSRDLEEATMVDSSREISDAILAFIR
jgi:uncharacterized protein YigE (DUF2233 family)